MLRTMADYARRENAAMQKATQFAGTYVSEDQFLKAGNKNHYGANDCLATERQVNSFKRMWEEGFSCNAMAERFRLTGHDVARKAREFGLPMRPHGSKYG